MDSPIKSANDGLVEECFLEIIRAEHMGFCSGVRRAVEIARAAVAEGRCAGAPVYACGPVIHNKEVGRELADLGLITVDSVDEIPFGAFYVVRSHGEGPETFDRARERGINVIDATCPKVRHIQKLAADAAARGRHVIIVGDAAHPEVQGIRAWAGGAATVVASPNEALPAGAADAVVVVQTTADEGLYTEIAAILESAGAEIHNTICSATSNRQRAARELAGAVDAMVVIGDRHSSNSRKLYEISSGICPNTYFIEGKGDLLLKNAENCNRIGITAGASTPERSIEEVIIGMSENVNGTPEVNPMAEYMEEIDKALRLPRNGDIITGEIIQITDKYVIVNIGCKKDGIIPRNEVNLEQDQELSDVFHEGEEVQAKVLKTDDGDGNILLSKKRAVVSEHWEDINKALEDKETLEVDVVKEVNGGVIAAFKEINGFVPMSQLSDRYVETAEEFVGKPMTVKVMRVDPKRNKVVFSHKAVLNEARQQRMMEIWDTINVGDIIDGKVMRFTEYGAFVDIGGIDGLLHISEISWGKLRHPEEVLSIDQEIKVKVLSMNKEKEKISLGYKQNLPEPWSVINEKYTVGQTITGKAVQIKDYGVFVELEPGLDGLVHISEIAYKRVNNIEDEISVGQEITAKILDIDSSRRRISLSIKETQERPTDDAPASSAREVDETRVPAGVPTSSPGASTGFSTTIGDRVKDALAEAAEATKEKAGEIAEDVKAVAETAAEKAGEIAEDVKEVAEAAVEKVEEAVEAVSEKTEEAAESFVEKVEEANAAEPSEAEVEAEKLEEILDEKPEVEAVADAPVDEPLAEVAPETSDVAVEAADEAAPEAAADAAAEEAAAVEAPAADEAPAEEVAADEAAADEAAADEAPAADDAKEE